MVLRFETCGCGMDIEPGGGRKVQKQSNSPEFGVALTAPLSASESVHTIIVFVNGDCNYWGLGVAVGALFFVDLLRYRVA